MAHLSLHNHVNVVDVHHDKGRQTVSLVAWPVTVTFKADEARRVIDEMVAALTGLAVKGAEAAEVDRG